jgi:hypothetical protein
MLLGQEAAPGKTGLGEATEKRPLGEQRTEKETVVMGLPDNCTMGE